MTAIAILLLAAGASSRMRGRDKLMEDVEGQPLLTLMCRRAALTGLPVYVTLPSTAHPRAAAACGAIRVPVPDAAEGMAASIRAGTAALPEGIQAVMILPADMPEIETRDLRHIAAQFHGQDSPILRAAAEDGTPGHPVLFPQRCFAGLKSLKGDLGARRILKTEEVQSITLPGSHAVTDLDTPEDWAAWRNR
ncbi:nucleotidyltransferase family protein [Leisingera aquaemixtae]|uniref:nucleotidyltransferase family protein n=1 Tax=Leisingera aquaemixtae TaxID=1396826 RepID=UPI001C939919|nr:nucleotidyltransferase family protein [Leisingera aquaemixtae]MBY6065443.1 nucleotidyltransferase family protein [Leisingera aquaemixtae]